MRYVILANEAYDMDVQSDVDEAHSLLLVLTDAYAAPVWVTSAKNKTEAEASGFPDAFKNGQWLFYTSKDIGKL